MIRATALITAATVGLAASALAEDKGKHRDRDNDVRTNLSEHIDTRLINEQNLTLIHVRITDEDTSPEAPPGENPQDSTTIIFQFFSEELGTLKYDCGQEIGPFVNALQVGERARHAEGDLTGLLGDEFACAEGRVRSRFRSSATRTAMSSMWKSRVGCSRPRTARVCKALAAPWRRTVSLRSTAPNTRAPRGP
jgi:hypothetical protein